MVFPHSIAPEKTLEALKAFQYRATVNAWNVPSDRQRPPDVWFALRPATLDFGGLSSVLRYSVDGPLPQGIVALDEYLGNPVVFYGHHDMFEGGIEAFDGVADQVNRLEPRTRWSRLEDLVSHLYLVKSRDDESGYDVRAFADVISLENPSARDAMFYMQKQETGGPAVKSVRVDGVSYPYESRAGTVRFNLPVQSGKSRQISIEYAADPLIAAAGEPGGSALRVYALRVASDFRDLVLPRYRIGRALVRLYYHGSRQPVEMGVYGLVLMIGCILTVWRVRRGRVLRSGGAHGVGHWRSRENSAGVR
jgi:hypothetical protein